MSNVTKNKLGKEVHSKCQSQPLSKVKSMQNSANSVGSRGQSVVSGSVTKASPSIMQVPLTNRFQPLQQLHIADTVAKTCSVNEEVIENNCLINEPVFAVQTKNKLGRKKAQSGLRKGTLKRSATKCMCRGHFLPAVWLRILISSKTVALLSPCWLFRQKTMNWWEKTKLGLWKGTLQLNAT